MKKFKTMMAMMLAFVSMCAILICMGTENIIFALL